MPEFGDTNPNERNEDAICNGEIDLSDAVQRMWDAGADVEEIHDAVKMATENVEVR